MTEQFVPGLELSRQFYFKAVEPLIGKYFPAIPHAAACIGGGSEVLGFDTARSTDHDWGPGVQLFLRTEDAQASTNSMSTMLGEKLPRMFLGYPTNFEPSVTDDSILQMAQADGTMHHRVAIAGLGDWLEEHLGFDPREGVTIADWLSTPTQTFAEMTGGAVFRDDLGELSRARTQVSWYPDDAWRYVLACQWLRIAREESFVGRAGEAGDELGSALIAGRLARDLMRLCLLMARTYPPYSKWLGSAFAQLPCSERIGPILTAAVAATAWPDRERHLASAYRAVAALHNELALTSPVDPATQPYLDRPFEVLQAERQAAALLMSVTNPDIFSLPLTGAIDQYVDSTDLLTDRPRARAGAAAILAC